MKRFYAVLLMMSLLLPLGAFATNLEATTSPNTLSKKTLMRLQKKMKHSLLI